MNTMRHRFHVTSLDVLLEIAGAVEREMQMQIQLTHNSCKDITRAVVGYATPSQTETSKFAETFACQIQELIGGI